MALRSVFCQQNVSENAEPVREALSSLVPDGGGIIENGDFAVAQTSTASMSLTVAPGRIWVPGTNIADISGTNWSTQGQYFVINDAQATVTIATANATNPRIDLVYVVIPDSFYAGTSNAAAIAVATGTPATGAAYPANAPTLPPNSYQLAWVYVAANAPTITSSNITQTVSGAVKPFGHLGKTDGFQTLPVNTTTTINMTSAPQILRGGMTNSGNALQVPLTGLYEVHAQCYFSGTATGTVIGYIQRNGTNAGPTCKANPDSSDTTMHCSSKLLLNSGDLITLAGYSGAQQAWGTDGYNGCFIEVEYFGA